MNSLKKYGLLAAAMLVMSLQGCFNDRLDVPDTPLAGKVKGSDWNFGSNSMLGYSSNLYRFILFSDSESVQENCSIVSTNNPHLQVILPLQQGSYSLPLPQPLENLKFVLGNGSELQAVDGFIEVLAIDEFRMATYIKAYADDNNTVEGRATFRICF